MGLVIHERHDKVIQHRIGRDGLEKLLGPVTIIIHIRLQVDAVASDQVFESSACGESSDMSEFLFVGET